MAVKTSVKVGGDILLHRESLQKNMATATLLFPAAGGLHDLPQVAGYPVVYVSSTKVATIVENGGTGNDTTDTNALLVHGTALEGVANAFATPANDLYTVINEGDGAVINFDALPTSDTLATPGTLVLSEVQTALEALGFKFVTEPVKISTHTT